jgi:hypothetical protein
MTGMLLVEPSVVHVDVGADWAAIIAAIASGVAAIATFGAAVLGIRGTAREAERSRKAASADLSKTFKAAHDQRAEDAERDEHRRSIEWRLSAYADFLDKARSFRNALRPYGNRPVPLLAPKDISALARSAHAASPRAFLVVESRRTRDALGELVRVMNYIQGVLDDDRSAPADKPWGDLNDRIKPALDKFEDAARQELEVRWTS